MSLQEALPNEPWGTLPLDMFRFGGGGALSWGTLCGALNGALFVMQIALGKTNMGPVGNDLMGWYTKYPFPSTALDAYTPYKKQVRTVAASPLCHNSVSIWCDAADKTVNSAEKKARCAKVAGETAARAAQLMNAFLIDNKFNPVFAFDPDTQGCMSCHTGPGSKYDDEQGKMACAPCHDDVKHDHDKFDNTECITCHK